MKKLFIFVLGISIAFGCTFMSAEAKKVKKTTDTQQIEATDIQNLTGLNSSELLNQEFKMPTDAEIKSVLEQFNFDEKQKEYLFKETKEKFKEMEEKSLQK